MLDDAPATACTRCRAALWDTELAAGRWACGRCEQTGFDQLRALPALFRRIDQTSALIKGRSGDLVAGTGSGSKPPLNLGILDLTCKGGVVEQLQAITDSWFLALRWQPGRTLRHDEIDEAVKPLINNIRWACENYSEIATDLKKISTLHGQLDRLDTGERPAHRIRVHCRTDDCHGRMVITMTTKWATCPDCGTEYDRDQLMRLDSDYGPNTIRAAA